MTSRLKSRGVFRMVAFVLVAAVSLLAGGLESLAATITVTAPNGGEKWSWTGTNNITWTSSGVTGSVKIELLKGATVFATLSAGTSCAAGTYSWVRDNTQKLSGEFKVRITSINDPTVSDMSNNAFAVSSDTYDVIVAVTAIVQKTPSPQITLNWNKFTSSVTGYTIYRRTPVLSGASWGAAIKSGLLATDTTWTDTTAVAGTLYEYKVVRAGVNGEGYVYAGIDVPMRENRGTVVLLVDNTLTAALAPELDQMKKDLVGDGWNVIRHDVPRKSVTDSGWATAVTDNKALIKADYDADPANVKSVYIIGHVAVPYSGDIAPDAHTDHYGAWPADVYYGDMTGTWTDATVNDTTSSDNNQHNIPGDGKFDQSYPPVTPVNLTVGRVDLYNMTAFTKSETELLRQYLNKDHNYRFKTLTAQPRVLIDANFGFEAFAQVAYRGFSTLAGGDDKVVAGDFFTTLNTQDYLFAHGNGGGSLTSAGGVGSTTDFASTDARAIFTGLFGSYHGDWDHTNSFLRAPLCTSYGLTCQWSGRPHWFFHPMAMGETYGYSHQLSQNNSGAYYVGNFTRQVHMALMGDPTLRLNIVLPVTNLVASTGDGKANLSWTASADANIVGYHVYRGDSDAGPFTRLTGGAVSVADPSGSAITATSYTDATGVVGTTYNYMVRAVKNEISSTGSYLNLSQGSFVQATPSSSATQPPAAPTDLVVAGNSATSNILAWHDNSADEKGFKVERKLGAGVWTELATLDPNTVTYTDAAASASFINYYRVYAFNDNGNSAYSNIGVYTGSTSTGKISLTASSFTVDKTAGSITFVVNRYLGGAGKITATYLTSDMTAVMGVNYTGTTGTLTWNAGDTSSKTFSVPIINVPGPQFARTFKVTLSGADVGVGTAHVQITDNSAAQPVGGAWTDTEISTGGFARSIGGAYGMTNSNGSLGGTSDACRFICQQMSGDFDFVARVAALDNITGGTGKAGVMARASTSADSPNVAALTTSANSDYEQRRLTTGAATTTAGTATNLVPPQWLRVARVGNAFTTYRSTDGVTWTQMGTGSIIMTDPIYVGITYSSTTTDIPGCAIFDSLKNYPAGVPAAPAGLAATVTGSNVSLAWTAVPSITGYKLERGDVLGNWTQIAAPAAGATSYSDSSLTSGQYLYHLCAVNGTGDSMWSNVAYVSILSGGFLSTTIGTVTNGGQATIAGSTHELKVAGGAMGGTSDNGRIEYLSTPVTGDFVVTARVLAMFNCSATTSLAGVMVRETANADAVSFIAGVSAGGQGAFLARTTTGGSAIKISGATNAIPYWVRLKRYGTTIIAESSADGVKWAKISSSASSTIGTGPMLVGLAFSPDNGLNLGTAQFDNFSVGPLKGQLDLDANAYTVGEKDGTLTVTVKRSIGASGAATVNYATTDGTAKAGTAFTATSGTLSWADADAADKTFTIPIIDNNVFSPDTTFTLTLSGVTGAELGTTTSATVTITNDETKPQVAFTAGTQSVAENAGAATVTMQLTNATIVPVIVPFTVSGTAVDGTDYTISASPVTIAAGATAGSVTVTWIDDAVYRGDHTVSITMGTPTDADLGGITITTLTITDNETKPTVAFSAASQSAAESAGAVTATIQLSAASGLPITVPFTVTGTAKAGTDYSITSSPMAIPAGSTTGTVTITLIDDKVFKGDRTVILTLGTPTNTELGAISVHTLTITDDDPAPSFTLTVVKGTGSGTYQAGTTVAIKADAPGANMHFDKWTGGGTAIVNASLAEATVKMPTSALTVTATYKGDVMTVSFAASPADGGMFSPSATATVEAGTAIILSATPAKGYSFDSWTATGTATFANDHSTNTKVTVYSDSAVTANFKASEPDTYALTVNYGTGSGSYKAETKVDIVADAPESGFFFDQWTGDVSSVADPISSTTTLTIPDVAATVTATYKAAVPCVVTLSVLPEGAGTAEISASPTYVGQTVRLTATPNDGYAFVLWSSASEKATIESTYTASSLATIEGDATITASFAVKAPIAKTFVKMDNTKASLDAVGITNSKLPAASLASLQFDPKADTLTVLVDGVPFKATATAGAFKQSGAKKVYKYTSKPGASPSVKIVLDLEKGLWTFSASKADKLSKTVDSSDGIGLFLVVTKKTDDASVFRAYGDSLTMIENTSWKYTTTASAPKTVTAMKIQALQGKYSSDKTAGNKDQFKAAGSFPTAGFEFDPKIDIVTVSIDGMWSQTVSDIDETLYTAKKSIKWKGNNDVDNSDVEVVVDMDKGLWSIKMGKGDLAGVAGYDGISVELGVGDYEGSATCKPFQRTLLKYKAK